MSSHRGHKDRRTSGDHASTHVVEYAGVAFKLLRQLLLYGKVKAVTGKSVDARWEMGSGGSGMCRERRVLWGGKN